MPASVKQGAEAAVIPANDYQRIIADIKGKVVPRPWQLTSEPREEPAAAKHPLQVNLVDVVGSVIFLRQTKTRPESGSSTVQIIFRSVVLPLPLGPRIARTCPAGAMSETFLRADVSPVLSRPSQLKRAGRWRNDLLTDSRTTAGCI